MKRLKLLAVLPLAAATVALGSQAATAAMPTATLTPASGPVGTKVTVNASGFKANDNIAVLLCDSTSASAAGDCDVSTYQPEVADSSGKVTASLTIKATKTGSGTPICTTASNCVVAVSSTTDFSTHTGAVFKLTTATTVKSFTAAPKPTITGKAKVGKKLTAHAGTWKPTATLKYQWLANGKKIAHATKATYKIAKKYKGKHISVKVTGSKAGYKTVSKVSKATKKVK